jgi:putative transposase
MQIEKGNIYHIYNQGNNRQKIFFDRENYLFFLKKIRIYILPYADIIAWCLMPNHFHLMVLVKEESVGVASSDTDAIKQRTINDSIGIMLRSYTNAINKQQKRSGKLFREKTKAECVNCFNGPTPNFINSNDVNIQFAEDQYPQVLFNYIHQNPVKAKLVDDEIDWEFSSAIDFYGKRNGKLINKQTAKKYVNS